MSDAKDDRLRDVPMVTRLRAVLNPACKGGRDADGAHEVKRLGCLQSLPPPSLRSLQPDSKCCAQLHLPPPLHHIGLHLSQIDAASRVLPPRVKRLGRLQVGCTYQYALRHGA